MRAAGHARSQEWKAAIVLDATPEVQADPPPRQEKWRRRCAQIGLWLLVASVAFSRRFEVTDGHTTSLFDLSVVACLALLLLMGLGRGTDIYPPRRIMFGMLILTMLTVTSIWWSEEFSGTLLAAGSWIQAIIVMTFVTVSLGEEPPSHVIKWLARLGLALLIAPILMNLHVWGFDPPADISRSSGDFLSYYARLSHPFLGRSNNLATVLVILYLPLAYWAEKYHRHRFAALTIGVAILLTLSRGVILALVISVVFLIIREKDRIAKLGRFLVIPLLVALPIEVIIMANVPAATGNIAARSSVAGVEARQELLGAGLTNLSHNLWIGAGAGAGESIHNTFLQQLIYFGLPLGLVAVVCLLQLPRWFFAVPVGNNLNHDLVRASGCGVVAGYLTFLTQSSLEGTHLRPVIFLCFGLCVALAKAGLRLDGQTRLGSDSLETLETGTKDTDNNPTDN